jgi:predicted dehydrogenase
MAEELQENPFIELMAICDVDPDRIETARETYGPEIDVTPEYSELLENDRIEAIAVYTTSAGHAPLSIQALEAGKHVLSTKPLAETVDEAADMIDAADRAGQVAAIDYQQRYHADNWTLSEIATNLDPVQLILNHQRGMFQRHFLKPGYSYGYMGDITHYVDLANWILDRRPVRVSGSVEYGAIAPRETVDVATIRIEYSDGRCASLTGSMGGTGLRDTHQLVGRKGNATIDTEEKAVTVHDIALDDECWEHVDGASREDWTLSADGSGSAKLEAWADRGQLASMRTVPTIPPHGDEPTNTTRREARQGLIGAFAAAVRGRDRAGREGLPTFRDGYDALRIGKAVLESDDRGETVYVDDVGPEVGPE